MSGGNREAKTDLFACSLLNLFFFLNLLNTKLVCVLFFRSANAKNSVFRFLETEEGTLVRFLIDLL